MAPVKRLRTSGVVVVRTTMQYIALYYKYFFFNRYYSYFYTRYKYKIKPVQ